MNRYFACQLLGGFTDCTFYLKWGLQLSRESGRELILLDGHKLCGLKDFGARMFNPVEGVRWISEHCALKGSNLWIKDLGTFHYSLARSRKARESDTSVVFNPNQVPLTPSIDTFKHFSFSEEVQEETRKSDIEGPYAAVHIRHSTFKNEYQTDFESVFNEIPTSCRVVVCTDSALVYEKAKERFPHLIELQRTRALPGERLHVGCVSWDRIVEMLSDLRILSRATHLITPPVNRDITPYVCEGYISGFGQLARLIKDNPQIEVFK